LGDESSYSLNGISITFGSFFAIFFGFSALYLFFAFSLCTLPIYAFLTLAERWERWIWHRWLIILIFLGLIAYINITIREGGEIGDILWGYWLTFVATISSAFLELRMHLSRTQLRNFPEQHSEIDQTPNIDEGEEQAQKRIAKYGVEVVRCSNCQTLNSSSFAYCINCHKDLSKEEPIRSPYFTP
jgi:hypothetical protein